MPSRVVIHRAPWVVPVSSPVLANGGVVFQDHTIVGVGSWPELQKNHAGARVVDHPDSVLLPPLVNGHTHLELSHLAHLSRQDPPATFIGWIEKMLAERERVGFDGDKVRQAARGALQKQHEDGVIAVADITNTGLSRDLVRGFKGMLLPFREFLGLRKVALLPTLKILEQESLEDFCTAHAPYSTHARLLQALKKRARQQDHVFPVHVAEPPAEGEMICWGRGELVEFLQKRGFWDGSFQATGIDNSGSVQYLHQLGILDELTLCVHCIHVTDREIELLRQSGAGICLCPGSNRYLGVGRPPVVKYLDHGILPALGTDSLASNPELSMWREMQLLALDHPGVAHAAILAMATLGGAQVLGLAEQIGTLAPGRRAALLGVELQQPVRDQEDVYSYLVTAGSEVRPQWIMQ